MTHSDVSIGHVVTSSVKLHQEAPFNVDMAEPSSFKSGRCDPLEETPTRNSCRKSVRNTPPWKKTKRQIKETRDKNTFLHQKIVSR